MEHVAHDAANALINSCCAVQCLYSQQHIRTKASHTHACMCSSAHELLQTGSSVQCESLPAAMTEPALLPCWIRSWEPPHTLRPVPTTGTIALGHAAFKGMRPITASCRANLGQIPLQRPTMACTCCLGVSRLVSLLPFLDHCLLSSTAETDCKLALSRCKSNLCYSFRDLTSQ